MDQFSPPPAAATAPIEPPGRRGMTAVRAILVLGIGVLVLLGWSATASASTKPSPPVASTAGGPGLVVGLVGEGGHLDPVLDLVTPPDPTAPSLRTPIADVAATVDPLLAPVAPAVQPTLDRVEALVVPAVAPVLEPVRVAIAPAVLPVAAPVTEALAPVTAELPALTAPAAPVAPVAPLPELPAVGLAGSDEPIAVDEPGARAATATTTASSTAADAATSAIPNATSAPSLIADLGSAPDPTGDPVAAADGAPSGRTPVETRAPSPSPTAPAPAAPAVPACSGPNAPTTPAALAAVITGAGLTICLPRRAAPPVPMHRLGSIPSAEPDVAPD